MGYTPPPYKFDKERMEQIQLGNVNREILVRTIAAVAVAAILAVIVIGAWILARQDPGYTECLREAQISYILEDGLPSESYDYARLVCRDLR